MATRLTVQLLGRFSVAVDGRVVPDEGWTRRRASALVKLLALAPDRRLPRERVLDALWPDLQIRAAGANLRKAAHFARRILAVPEAIVLTGESVNLLPDGSVETDVERFTAAARDALQGSSTEACRSAATLYRGDLLPEDAFEPWCERARDDLRGLYRALLERGALWGRLLELDPASEVAHREIMRERMAAGDRSGAIRQFEQMRVALRDELGVSPGAESMAVYDDVLDADEPGAPTPAERARALLAWGTIHWERSDLPEAERTAAQARALAIDAGLGRELADASELLGLIAYAQGRWREVFADEFLGMVEHTPELAPFIFDAHLCMSEFALHEVDGMGAVARFADRLIDIAGPTGASQIGALARLLRGEVELLRGGDLEVARQHLHASIRLHENTGSTTGGVIARERLAQTMAFGGDLDAAQQAHREALARAADTAIPNHLVPLIYGGLLESARPEVAADVVDEGEAALAGTQPCIPCSMSFHIGAAKASVERDPKRAHTHLDAAARAAEMWQDGPWHAAVSEARAMLLMSEGADAADARRLLEDAAERFHVADRERDERRCRASLRALT